MTWREFFQALGRPIGWLFRTPRRGFTTVGVIAVLVFLASAGVRHWFTKDVVDPVVSCLVLIGVLLLIFRVAVKGKIGKIKK